jgi:hypothetical protein
MTALVYCIGGLGNLFFQYKYVKYLNYNQIPAILVAKDSSPQDILSLIFKELDGQFCFAQRFKYQFNMLRFRRGLRLDRLPVLDRKLLLSRHFICGYFQSPYSLEEDLLMISSLKSNVRGHIYQKELSSLRYIAVHVRRGDYHNRKNRSIGILSLDYYLKALTHAFSFTGPLPFVIVSEHLSDAREVSRDLAKHGFSELEIDLNQLCGYDQGSLAGDLAVLMNATVLVIANSSFSAMAAQLSTSRLVLYPYPWFSSLLLSNTVLPVMRCQRWQPIHSSFMPC